MESGIIERDLAHVWHPCSQMKDYHIFPPVPVCGAEGSFLIMPDGRKLIDGISSWWCKSLGHRHPKLEAAMHLQASRYEHIIAANTVQEPLVELAEKLSLMAPGMDRVFFADNGSTAVEIAMKMSLQYHVQAAADKCRTRTRFVSLRNGYHGETILTLAVGDCGLYSAPYASILPDIPKIGPLPERLGPADPDWQKLRAGEWETICSQLEAIGTEEISAIVFEPVVQGAGGMRIYSPELLRRLRSWTTARGIHLIADEIMTGFYRTGPLLACRHAGITPDFICLSKGLTGGCLPMSAVLCTSETYEAFYADYFSGKAFLHSNTYCGNAMAAATACAALEVMAEENIEASVTNRACELRRRLEHVAAQTGALGPVRGLGFIVAAELRNPADGEPFPKAERRGFRFFQEAVSRGAFLRPLGDNVYFLPPLNTPDEVLDQMAEIAEAAIFATIA